jgi:GNAT superfamily N-acetyltransferase
MRMRAASRDDLLPMGRVAEAAHWDTYTGLLKPDTIGRMLSADYSPGAIARRLMRGGVVIAESEGHVLGFVDAVPEPASLEVSAINVDPGFRRRGVGTALLVEAGGTNRELPLRADVLLGNLDAERFFEALGFVPGEIEHSKWFEEDVFERRWWREPA